MRIHQLCARVEFGDAVSNDVLQIDKKLKEWGFETHIFAESFDHTMKGTVGRDVAYRQFFNNPDDLLIFHYSVYSPHYKLYLRSKNKKIFIYHNITPSHFFRGYNHQAEHVCRKGRELLSRLSNCDLALGDSEFNREELVENGFPQEKTGVLPIFLDFEKYQEFPPDGDILERFEDDYFNILFVGRRVPNKKFEDLIKTFYYYNRCVNAKSRLFLVGAPWLSKYENQLYNLVMETGLYKKVVLTHKVSNSELKTYYEMADVLLCMSEHEGFCIPLIESMYFEIPIVAYKSAAIPFTLDGAGAMFSRKDYARIAELLDLIQTDSKFREGMIKRQSKRLEDFSASNVERLLRGYLKMVIQRDF